MPTSIAHVSTAKPGPYLRQLCRHFSHKTDDDFTVEFTDDTGRMTYRSADHGLEAIDLDATAGDVLVLTASGDTEAGLRDIEGWAGGHLVRFGKRDELIVDWQDA